MYAIELKNLTKTYPAARPLDNLTLSIPQGCITAFIGESGCGKTTLLRLICGLEKADSGTIGFTSTERPGTHPVISMVFQEHRLFPWMSVRENIAVALRNLPEDTRRQRVDQVIELVRLTRFAGAYPNELSGGMSQRVGLARALAVEPDILLLDEAFSALDALTRQRLYAEFIDICSRRSMTTLLVTHDVTEAVLLANNVVHFDAGRVIREYPVPFPYPRSLATPGLSELSQGILDTFLNRKDRL